VLNVTFAGVLLMIDVITGLLDGSLYVLLDSGFVFSSISSDSIFGCSRNWILTGVGKAGRSRDEAGRGATRVSMYLCVSSQYYIADHSR